MAPPLTHLSPPYATPSSNSSLDYRRSDARIVENGFATSGGLSKSAKVVLVQFDRGGIVQSGYTLRQKPWLCPFCNKIARSMRPFGCTSPQFGRGADITIKSNRI